MCGKPPPASSINSAADGVDPAAAHAEVVVDLSSLNKLASITLGTLVDGIVLAWLEAVIPLLYHFPRIGILVTDCDTDVGAHATTLTFSLGITRVAMLSHHG